MTQVLSEMVAGVWKVLVSEGDVVSQGDVLVILESMKMEIPVESPIAGTVKSLLAEEGATIQEGDVIAVIE